MNECRKRERLSSCWQKRPVRLRMQSTSRKKADLSKGKLKLMTLKRRQLQEKLDTELLRQRGKIEDIKTKTLGEFDKDHRDLTKEIDNRFEQ